MLKDMESLGIQDRNRDGIADYLEARIYVADDASASELAAAANLAARLAFETTSLDLPLAFPVSAYEEGHGRAIFVGSAANNATGAGAILLPDVVEAERFACTVGIEDYKLSWNNAEGAPPTSRVALNSIFQWVQRIVLAPDVQSLAVIDLAARASLESTKLELPLVVVVGRGERHLPKNSILIGASNPYVQQLVQDGTLQLPQMAGQGRIVAAESNVVIVGSDPAGEDAALRYASLQMPYLREYGKGNLSFDTIEDEVRRYTPHSAPQTEVIFDTETELGWEVDEALQRVFESVMPAIRHGDFVHVDLRLSEPREIREDLSQELRRLLSESGASSTSAIRVLPAHKQGFSWIDEELKPLLKGAARIRLLYREMDCSVETLDPPDRWLHELYPIDEVLARDLGIPCEAITFERVPLSAQHIYEVIAEDSAGNDALHASFDPCFVTRPLFDRFPDYAAARVATGCLRVQINDHPVVDMRIKADYERFWDEYQRTLSRIGDYVLGLHGGRVLPEHAPHFEELSVEVALSEPDVLLGIDEERISTLEALHEDIYFETLLFFDILGTSTCGKPLKYPGRIIPRVAPSRPGAGRARVRLTGYRVPFRSDTPLADADPRVTAITVQAGAPGVSAVEVSIAEARFCWILDSHEDWPVLAPAHRHKCDIPQDQPIGPAECERIIARLSTFDAVRPSFAGKSWLGHSIWVMDVMSPVTGKYFSEAKASATKPCLYITGRQHANEVSSTTHILNLAEKLATDPEYRRLLDRVNFVLQPITNPDGAALVDELHRATPGFMLHAGYLGALGVDVTDQQWSMTPKYPEARIRADVWRNRQPDIVLNPHGYPSHEWVQLFAGYTAWVRSKRSHARDWWIPRGWFMPRFEFIEDDRFPSHRAAALVLADRISAAINQSIGSLNERMYRRYRKYMSGGLDLHHGVLLNGMHEASPDPNSFGFMTRHPEITFFEGLSEVPDEVASGEWLQMVSKAGLEFSLVHARFLADLPQNIIRTRSENGGALTLRISRQRLPLVQPL